MLGISKSDLIHRALQSGGSAASLITLMRSRSSCRAFLNQPVERSVIESILAIAQLTPSWCNSQPWETIVTLGDATDRFRDALRLHAASSASPDSDFARPQYRGSYKERQRECAWQLYETVGIQFGDREASARQTSKNFELFGAPHVMIVTTPADLGTYGAVDCGAFISNFMLAARSFNVATIAQAALAMHSSFVRQWFSIPYERLILCGVSFGYADRTAPANSFETNRVEPSETSKWIDK